MANKNKEWVSIKHPNQKGVGRVTRAAFEKVWQPKGFRIHEEPETTSGGSTTSGTTAATTTSKEG